MGQLGEENPILIAQTGPLNGQRWIINKNLLIGRDSTCDIVIQQRQVSRQHARILSVESGLMLEDLGSKNGTHCNGQHINNPIPLKDGDVIQIALIQVFLFTSSDATLPLDEEDSSISLPIQGLLKLDKKSRRVWIGDQEINPPLSVSQYKLLEILYENPQQVVPRTTIIEYVWGNKQADYVSEQALDALVRRLRERITIENFPHEFITTIRGHGLRLDNPAS
jgi:pSer/pThr/pTyr-binding forkhead associated (FHA) protein